MDRIEQTGRHLKGLSKQQETFFLQKYQEESNRAIQEFPKAAKVVHELLESIDFEKIRDMYREMNAASQGRHIHTPEKRSLLETHARLKAPTNELTKNHFLSTVLKDAHGNINGHTAMQYADIPNVILVNLGCTYFSDLERLTSKETLTPSDIAEKQYVVTKLFQLIFHELGHGYQYVYSATHEHGDMTYQKVQHSAHQLSITTRQIPETDSTEVTTKRTGTMFLEGWNDLLSSILMVEYLHSHSLRFEDVTITSSTPGIQDLVGAQFFDSDYGPASYSLWAIANHIAEHAEVDITTVIKGFIRVSQTKQGMDDLQIVLTEILGEPLARRFFAADAHEMNGEILAHDIMEKLQSPDHWVQNILEIITRPDKRS